MGAAGEEAYRSDGAAERLNLPPGPFDEIQRIIRQVPPGLVAVAVDPRCCAALSAYRARGQTAVAIGWTMGLLQKQVDDIEKSWEQEMTPGQARLMKEGKAACLAQQPQYEIHRREDLPHGKGTEEAQQEGQRPEAREEDPGAGGEGGGAPGEAGGPREGP